MAYRTLLGVDTSPDWVETQDINKQAKKYNIPAAYNFVLDTASFRNSIKTLYLKVADSLKLADTDSTKKHVFKKALNDDLQPTQFRLFTKNGQEIFKLVNCYIDPPIPMNWNIDGCFNVFPPKISYETLAIHRFDLNFLLTHVSGIDGQKITLANLPKADYYAVVFWNDFYKRPSRKLIKRVQKYVKNQDENIALIYINNQNQVIWGAMNFEQKQSVFNYLVSEK